MDYGAGAVVVPAPDVGEAHQNWSGPPNDVLIRLEGHDSAVTALCFHPRQPFLASCGFDGTALLWQIDEPSTQAILSYTGHKSSLTSVAFVGQDGNELATASADKTATIFDLSTAIRIRTYRGHESHVTCIDSSASFLADEFISAQSGNGCDHCVVTGSNDRTARVWDTRSRGHREDVLFRHSYQVLDVKFGLDLRTVYTSGIEPRIYAWDTRRPDKPVLLLDGHSDMVTGISVSPLGSHLASHGADGKVGLWDLKPFVGGGGDGQRLERFVTGSVHGFEQNLMRLGWDRCGTRVVAGSADGTVMVWDADDGELVCHLGGHQGCVNDVRFCPVVDTLIASASSDKFILLGHIPSTA